LKLDTVTLKRLFSPHAYRNLDTFVEQLPLRAGQGIIIAGVAAWLAAGLAVTYVTMQANHVMALRADILKAESLKPSVPVISKIPVGEAELQPLVKRLTALYPQINISSSGNQVLIRGALTDKYGAYREAAGHVFNGGKGWRMNVESMCVGRECEGAQLLGTFSVNRLQVDKPAG